jgi:hypothetical protein
MGRPQIEIDTDVAIDLLTRGHTQKEVAQELGISPITLGKRIADIQAKQPLLTQYRVLQSLQLTELQCRVLEAITPEKIADAPLRDLVLAFKVLKDKELVLDGKPTEIKGLLGYLIQLEKEDAAVSRPTPGQYIDVDTSVKQITADYDDENYIPDL